MRYGKLGLTRSLFYAYFDALVRAHGEQEALRLLQTSAQWPGFQAPKYGDITEGRLEALLNIIFGGIGEQYLEDILKRRLVPEWKRVERLLMDSVGRCIPEDLEDTVLPPNTSFKLEQADFKPTSVSARLDALREFYPISGAEFPSLDEVMTRFEQIQKWLQSPRNQESGVVNLLQGAHFLGIMPKIKVDDLGAFVEMLVEAAGQRYKKQYPERQFHNYRRGELKGKVGIAEGARYGNFMRRASKRSSVWLSFRACLQGYSIPAAREQEKKMPERLILCGAVDTAMDIMAYPEILARSFQTVGQDCSANTFSSADHSLYFEADGGYLGFDDRDLDANGSCSGGLLLLG